MFIYFRVFSFSALLVVVLLYQGRTVKGEGRGLVCFGICLADPGRVSVFSCDASPHASPVSNNSSSVLTTPFHQATPQLVPVTKPHTMLGSPYRVLVPALCEILKTNRLMKPVSSPIQKCTTSALFAVAITTRRADLPYMTI